MVQRNIADKGAIRRAKKDARRERFRELEDLRKICRVREGRRFIWRYLTECHVFESSISGSTLTTFALEGERNIGVLLLKDINEADPRLLLAMIQENAEEKDGEENARTSDAATTTGSDENAD